MKYIISIVAAIFLFLIDGSNAQDITNTLAPNGNFKIKDGATDYFILSQSNGTISLISPLAGNMRGSIFKGGNRFLHTYNGDRTEGYNTFIGLFAGNFTMGGSGVEGSYNTGVGYNTLYSNTTGYYNTASGTDALYYNTTGFENTASGRSALYSNIGGFSNTATGFSTLYSNTYGYHNTANGASALFSNTTGYYNTASGTGALYYNTTGFENTASGKSALQSNTTGNNNTASGYYALYSNTTGGYNTGTGSFSLYSNTTGINNTASGYSAIYSNTTGYDNTAIGTGALYYNTTGFENTANGRSALQSNTTGRENTAVGHKSLYSNESGSQNTSVGDSALYNNTGNYNTAIGYNSGSTVTTGYNLTLVGIDANPSSPTAIDQITLGNQFVSSLRCNVQTITSLSDVRDKKNIKDLSLGLDFIIKLKPRQFNWDRREWYEGGISDGSKLQETPTAGFIAQEFDEVQKTENAEWLNLVLKDNPEKWEATYGNLLPVVVKAVQELKVEKDEEIAQLKNENEKLKTELESLKELQTRLAKLEQVIINSDIKFTSNINE